ncbi:MAG: hypothetical protein EP299_01805 [Acidobacteria bacterium]|nr:MAG: hypothetical protein EP299_01805 [Acidobacteriota bacterium]
MSFPIERARWYVLRGGPVSDRYHPGGSLLVRAVGMEEAIEKANAFSEALPPYSEKAPERKRKPNWLAIAPLADSTEDVIAFPDAGCC